MSETDPISMVIKNVDAHRIIACRRRRRKFIIDTRKQAKTVVQPSVRDYRWIVTESDAGVWREDFNVHLCRYKYSPLSPCGSRSTCVCVGTFPESQFNMWRIIFHGANEPIRLSQCVLLYPADSMRRSVRYHAYKLPRVERQAAHTWARITYRDSLPRKLNRKSASTGATQYIYISNGMELNFVSTKCGSPWLLDLKAVMQHNL